MNLYQMILKKNFELQSKHKGSRVLDVGCGNGDEVFWLRASGYKCFGVDIDFKDGDHRQMLEEAGIIKIIETHDKNRETLAEGDFYKWPTFGQRFDVVVSKAVLEHVRDFERFLIEMICSDVEHRYLYSLLPFEILND